MKKQRRKQVILTITLLLVAGVFMVAGVFAGDVLSHSHGDHHGRGHMGSWMTEENFREQTMDMQREILRNTEKIRALRQEYRDKLLAHASEADLEDLESEILSLQHEREREAMDRFRGIMGHMNFDNFSGRRDSHGMGMMGHGRMMGTSGMMNFRETSGFRGMRHTTINSEYEFLIHMIPHHEEAVNKARLLRENTEREEMRDFAEEIIRTQTDEIEQMESWLETWYPERDHDFDYQPMMRELSELEDQDLDRAFLEDMIFHHMEAVMTARQLLSRGLAEREETAALAEDIFIAQREEIFMMRSWLNNWYQDEQIIGRGHRGRMWRVRETEVDRDLSEEDEQQIREIKRTILKNREELQELRSEYQQLLLAEASEEELITVEDDIIELKSEIENDLIRLRDKESLSPVLFRGLMGDSSGSETHCW